MMKKLSFLVVLVFCAQAGFSQTQPEYAVQDYSQKPVITESKLYLGFAGGLNNYTGLIGPTLEYRLADKISVYGAAGLGSWGSKLSAGIRYYSSFPSQWAFGLGVSHATGIDRLELEMQPEALVSGVATKVPFKLKGANTVNISAMKNWLMGKQNRNRFQLELGYAIPIVENQYEILSTDELSRNGKLLMNVLQPGGIIIGLGFSFGL